MWLAYYDLIVNYEVLYFLRGVESLLCFRVRWGRRRSSYFDMVPFWDMFILAKIIFIRDIVILEDMSAKNYIRLIALEPYDN